MLLWLLHLIFIRYRPHMQPLVTLDTIAAPSGRVHHIFQHGSSVAAVGIDEDVKRVIDEEWSIFGTVDV